MPLSLRWKSATRLPVDAEGLTPDELIKRLMQKVRPPEKPMQAHVRVETEPKTRAPAQS